jgi:hypothetical protein
LVGVKDGGIERAEGEKTKASIALTNSGGSNARSRSKVIVMFDGDELW